MLYNSSYVAVAPCFFPFCSSDQSLLLLNSKLLFYLLIYVYIIIIMVTSYIKAATRCIFMHTQLCTVWYIKHTQLRFV